MKVTVCIGSSCHLNVDAVITTQELIRMIKESGVVFDELEPEAVDMPFGTVSNALVLANTSTLSRLWPVPVVASAARVSRSCQRMRNATAPTACTPPTECQTSSALRRTR